MNNAMVNGAPADCYLKVSIPDAFAKSKVYFFLLFYYKKQLGEIMSYWDDTPSY